ncbi:hypothetical protein LCDV1gp028 [Lymphocystis disease virus 1]|uniref:hypothetical protein n=1 Tax=Fish lymphocystis disease virus TaxID=36363 RepID=UPI0000161F02|nr:hypothetical protein LCDV1gp028 [Lymphocystis disease virus 1]
MIKNVLTIIIWQVIGIVLSHYLIANATKTNILFFIGLQTIISMLLFEYGSKYIQLGYFSTTTLLLTQYLQTYLNQ